MGEAASIEYLGKAATIEAEANERKVADKLGVPGEVVVDSCGHLKPPVVSEVQHVALHLLPPVLPPVYLDLGLGDVTINVLVFDGVGAHPISVQGRVFGDWFTFNNNIFNIIHMNCLLEFRKMTFTIHFIFTFLTGIIF